MPQQLLAVPHSSQKGCNSLSPVKVKYQTVEIFHGEIQALKDSGVDEQCPQADSSSLALYDVRRSSSGSR